MFSVFSAFPFFFFSSSLKETCMENEGSAWQSGGENSFMFVEGDSGGVKRVYVCVQPGVGGGLHVQVYCIDVRHENLLSHDSACMQHPGFK